MKKHSCCHHKGLKHPGKSSTEETVGGLIYICPMHLEVRQTSPGNCPICGMALEPETSTKDAKQNPEYIDLDFMKKSLVHITEIGRFSA